MALPDRIRHNLALPAVCAPMFLISRPELVSAACCAGVVGALARSNARDIETFESWLKDIRDRLDRFADANPDAPVGPLAVNLATRMPEDELRANLDLCGRYGVEIIISATGDPTELASQVHDWGGIIWHDVVSLRFAEKAMKAGVDGMTCVGAGGGGHSGNVGHLVLIPRIREMFDGTLLMAGSISTGAAIRAAEILGADLAYMGTRFIATQESRVDPEYHAMLVESGSEDLMFTGKIAGVPANWLVKSMERVGLDPRNLPSPQGRGMRYDHLPETVRPWKNMWSAGQGIDLISDIPTVAELVERLQQQYRKACDIPAFHS
ncbi:MAG: nitronate monooxygenase [Blastomonas sp.]